MSVPSCTNTLLTCVSQLFNKKSCLVDSSSLIVCNMEKKIWWLELLTAKQSAILLFFLEISLLVSERLIPHSQPLKIRVAMEGESNCVATLTTSCKGDKMLIYCELLLVRRETKLMHARSVQIYKGSIILACNCNKPHAYRISGFI